ncbi:MAG TPA: PA2169 family four-helix-bundle protein [Tepidisphaeraceae bacterium]|nr:PA2169 family four-helix-bundle protein [Tepidisphaeraceae bacterium]
MQTTHDVSDTLNHLLEICRDGEEGFQTAANAIEDPSLKAELMQYSMQRRDFETDLVGALGTFGETARERGSVSGAVHRGWINIKAAIAGKNSHAVLAECERGEDSAVEAYRDAINSGLPTEVAPLVESQFEQVQRVHDRVKFLRDSFKST